jgi:hypothetical protein
MRQAIHPRLSKENAVMLNPMSEDSPTSDSERPTKLLKNEPQHYRDTRHRRLKIWILRPSKIWNTIEIAPQEVLQ